MGNYFSKSGYTEEQIQRANEYTKLIPNLIEDELAKNDGFSARDGIKQLLVTILKQRIL